MRDWTSPAERAWERIEPDLRVLIRLAVDIDDEGLLGPGHVAAFRRMARRIGIPPEQVTPQDYLADYGYHAPTFRPLPEYRGRLDQLIRSGSPSAQSLPAYTAWCTCEARVSAVTLAAAEAFVAEHQRRPPVRTEALEAEEADEEPAVLP